VRLGTALVLGACGFCLGSFYATLATQRPIYFVIGYPVALLAGIIGLRLQKRSRPNA
jgi:hypothetical protein